MSTTSMSAAYPDPPTETETEYTVTETETETENENKSNNQHRKKKAVKKKLDEMTPAQLLHHEERRKAKHKQYKAKIRQKRQQQSKQPDLSETERKIQAENNLNDLIQIANGMYKQLKDIVKADGERFTQMPDKNKLQFFREELKYDEFMKEFPVTTRYLICMGQYSSKAFRRFLNKIKMAVHPPLEERPKGYMEDQWIRRQSDYVRFLWESYQKGHWNNNDANAIWQESYERLKGEFDDFRDKYKEIEKSTKLEKKQHNAEVAKELLERYANGIQSPKTDEEKKELLRILQDQVYRHRFNKSLVELKEKTKLIEPVSQGRGMHTGSEDKPTIRMIEHINPDRMHEVPEHMKLTKDELKHM